MELSAPDGRGSAPDWLATAINLARSNVKAGGWPFGAVIVLDGRLVATAVNEVSASKDPTAHAEILAIRDACALLDDASLAGARGIRRPGTV